MSKIRANQITNENCNGAPTFTNGLNSSGIVTSTTTATTFSGNLTVTGNLGASGTLTYEDVSSIDSVGIITARSGVKVGPTAGVGGTFFADGSYNTAGIVTAVNVSVANSVTAVSYYGDGSNLSNISNGILEQISGQCDGSTRTCNFGTFTFPNVTAPQQLNQSASYNEVTGLTVNYKPPAGCIGVLVNWNYQVASETISHDIQHYKMYIKNADGSNTDDGLSGEQEIVYARWTHGGEYQEDVMNLNHYFRIKGSGSYDSNTGALPTWTTIKRIRIVTRPYSVGGHEVGHFHTTYYWDGGGNSHQFRQPNITITAFGSPT